MTENYVAGLVVLGVILFLVIVALVILTLYSWVLGKALHKKITELEEQLESLRKIVSVSKSTIGYGDKAACDDISEIDRKEPSRPDFSESIHRGVNYTMIVAEKVKKVKTNVPQHVSQLVRTAELAYHGDSVTKRDLMLDKIDIEFSDESMKAISAPSKRQTIFQGRPTSYIMADDKLLHGKGTFIHKMVTESGYVLRVSGVELTIPQGAVSKDVQITVGIMWEENFLPSLTAKQALLSPLVICQPSLAFKKPVTLAFPHCAHNVKGDWNTTILKREGSENIVNNWSPIEDKDFSWKEITDTSVSVALYHFTGFTLVGESAEGKVAAKAVNMVAFSNPFHTGAMYKTKIYCVSHYHYREKIQEVKTEEKSVNRRQTEGAVPLLVYQNGENVTATLAKYKNEEWRLEGGQEQSKQELDYGLLMHDLLPSCSYVLSPISNAKKIFCEYNFAQNKSKNATKLIIADATQQILPTPLIQAYDDPVSELHRQMILMLDPTSEAFTDHGDWRSLAANVGLTNEEIRWLELRQSTESPTAVVLEKLADLGKTYQNLHTILIDIKRPDVASVLDKFLGENGNDVILQEGDRVRMRHHVQDTLM